MRTIAAVIRIYSIGGVDGSAADRSASGDRSGGIRVIARSGRSAIGRSGAGGLGGPVPDGTG
jgi:hypothetical protein